MTPGDKARPKARQPSLRFNRLSARRMVGAALAKHYDEWAEARRYLTIPNG